VPRLDEYLDAHGPAVIARWLVRAQEDLHGESMPPIELVDHLPMFLREVAASLRARSASDGSATAAMHGENRLRLGFSLPAVVREYGLLRDAIVDSAREAGVPIERFEHEVLFDCTITAIADAVGQYARQRDADVQRQANEHYAFVAHELRDPLHVALFALQRLQRNPQATDTGTLDNLERSLSRMRDVIDQSLRVARVGAGVELRVEQATLPDLLFEVERAQSDAAEQSDVKLVAVAEGNDAVSIDRRLLSSALGNLVRNAIKFTHPGGTVALRGRVSGTHAVIECEDECGGIDPKEVERAFAPFVQLKPDNQRGFGLGLAIAKQAADAHGGSLRVQNLPGKGCMFVLEIPIAAPPEGVTLGQ